MSQNISPAEEVGEAEQRKVAVLLAGAGCMGLRRRDIG
jgi:hypothetical protein